MGIEVTIEELSCIPALQHLLQEHNVLWTKRASMDMHELQNLQTAWLFKSLLKGVKQFDPERFGHSPTSGLTGAANKNAALLHQH
eukprot:3074523-Amphidinium_carterae.1